MKARAGYTKGMNKDVSSDRRNPNMYYNLENFRIVTEDGLTTGSLVNESSTVAKFQLPDLEELTLTDGTVIPAQANLKIVGWTTIIDRVVVFSTNEESDTPNSYGQIWVFQFNEATGEITGIDNGFLDPDTHLYYNQKLNFSTYYRIGRAVGRYENGEIQRVYWTDNFNSVRVFNIAVENPLDTPLDNVSLAANIALAQPVIETIGSGSLPTGAMIQFAYRLKTEDGAETIFSPTSKLYPLTETSPYNLNWNEFEGDGDETTLTRSVTYNIKGIDTDWDVIEHVAIIYTEQDVYTIYSFDEETVPESGEVSVTCSDVQTALIVPLVEFNIIQSGFDVAKDILVHQNRLVAANTRTKKFSVDFDARAYRFNSAQEALLTDINEGNITLDGTAPDYASIPLIHDAINPYNNENDADWDTNSQYKFKADGVTYGGEGLNVSYRFVTEEVPANFISNTQVTTTPPHLLVDSWNDSAPAETLGVLEADGTLMEFERGNQLKNSAGALQHSVFKGYARGETYRFGIVFYNSKGSPTFVNWIGDIRMPEPDDGFPIMENIGSFPYMHNLGVEFTVDTSSIQDDISGYSIVRVKREAADRTRLGTGMLMWFDIFDLSGSLIHNWEAWNDGPEDGVVSSGDPWPLTHDVDAAGSPEAGYHLPMKPGWHDPQLIFNSAKKVCFLLSPLGQNVEYSHKNEDFLKTYAYYGGPAVQYTTGPDSGSDGGKSYGFSYKTDGYLRAGDHHDTERFQIDKARRMRAGEFFYSGDEFIDGYTGVNSLRNASASRAGGGDQLTPLGIGNLKIATMLAGGGDITLVNANDPTTEMGYVNNIHFQNQSFGSAGSDVANTDAIFKEVAVCRYVANQYGGDRHEDRSQNQYISTGHYQVVNANIGSALTFNTYGGDIFLNYYDDEFCEQYWNSDGVFGGIYNDPPGNKLSIAACFPTETIVNQDYRNSKRWFVDRDGDAMSDYQANTYTYKAVWSQEDIAQEKFFAEDFLAKTTEEHPHQLWASEPKIDGEFTDSWRIFQANNAIEVTGIYGPINRIINFNNRIFFYQNSAIGQTTIGDRVMLNDTSGQEIAVGTGGVFPDYGYISTVTGSIHQFSVIDTEAAIYHWDARLRKLFRTTGGKPEPISDSKGMASFFHNLEGEFLAEDRTLRSINFGGAVGVHGVQDYRYNRVLFTFMGVGIGQSVFDYEVEEGSGIFSFTEIGAIIEQGGTLYVVEQEFSVNAGPGKEPNLDLFVGTVLSVAKGVYNDFTVSFSEYFDAFEGFYSFTPNIYLQYGRRLMSATPNLLDSGWEHNIGETYCNFYGTQYPSSLETVLGQHGTLTKVFDTLQWQGTVTDINGQDIAESFDRLRVHNEYQDTGLILLGSSTLERHFRLWRTQVPRDSANSLSRIRAPWTHLFLEYDNVDGHKHTVKDIEYSFRQSKN